MQELRQSTAATLKIGPFLDDSDGKTAEPGLTISQADVQLSKNGGSLAQKNESSACTYDKLGYYDCPVDTTDTGTSGRLLLAVHEDGALPVWHEYMVMNQNDYDAKYSTDKLQVDVVEVSGDSTAADNLEADYDGTGYNKSASTIGTATNLTNPNPTAAAIADAVLDETKGAHTGLIAKALPDVAPAANGGLPTVDANNRVAGIQGTKNTLDDLSGADGDTLKDISDEVAGVQSDTNDLQTQIGTAGAGLTDVPWNAAWDAEVQSEAEDAIVANNLDHLCKTATVGADMTAEVADNTIISRILANGDTSAFDPSTDGLQPLRDTAPHGTAMRGTDNAATAAALTTHDGKLDTVDTNVDSILADTGTDGVAIATATAQAIADEVLKRGAGNVEDAADAHSLVAIILATLESALSGTTWTIKKTDGTTFTTKTVTTDDTAAPITAVT